MESIITGEGEDGGRSLDRRGGAGGPLEIASESIESAAHFFRLFGIRMDFEKVF
jgi:hypothetical protein